MSKDLKYIMEWRWVDENGRAMTKYMRGQPPLVMEVVDEKGQMRIEVRMLLSEKQTNTPTI